MSICCLHFLLFLIILLAVYIYQKICRFRVNTVERDQVQEDHDGVEVLVNAVELSKIAELQNLGEPERSSNITRRLLKR